METADRQRTEDRMGTDGQKTGDKVETDRQRTGDRVETDGQRTRDRVETDKHRTEDRIETADRQRERHSAGCALCALSVLMLVLGMLLSSVLSPLHPFLSANTHPLHYRQHSGWQQSVDVSGGSDRPATDVSVSRQQTEEGATEGQIKQDTAAGEEAREDTEVEQQTREDSTVEQQTREDCTVEQQTRADTTTEQQTSEGTTVGQQTREGCDVEHQNGEDATAGQTNTEDAVTDANKKEDSPTEKDRHQDPDFPSDVPATAHPAPSSTGHEEKGDNPPSHGDVPYHASTVRAQALEMGWRSLTGQVCERVGCHPVIDKYIVVTSMVVTADRRLAVVMSNLLRPTLQVFSVSGVDTIPLPCRPCSLLQLPSGLLALTCPENSMLLMLDMDGEEHVAQHIVTKRSYCTMAHGDRNRTIIAAAWTRDLDDATIDVITYQGDVIRTLLNKAQRDSLTRPTSLNVVEGDLLVSDVTKDVNKSVVFRLKMAQDVQHVEVVADRDRLLFPPTVVAVDTAGNLFIGHLHGVSVMGQDGQVRRLLDLPERSWTYPLALTLFRDRLLVGWRNESSFVPSLVEYVLHD